MGAQLTYHPFSTHRWVRANSLTHVHPRRHHAGSRQRATSRIHSCCRVWTAPSTKPRTGFIARRCNYSEEGGGGVRNSFGGVWRGHICAQPWWQTGAEGNLYELDKNSETVYQIKGGFANPLPLLLSGLPFFHWITTFRPRQSDTLGSNVSLATVLAVVCVWASPAAYRRRNAADASRRRRSAVEGIVSSLFTSFSTVIIHPSIQARCRRSRFIILGSMFPKYSMSA